MAALPIADRPEVIAEAKLLVNAHRWAFIKMLFFYAGAAVSALFGPWILGNLTNEATHHQLTGHKVTVMVCQLAVASVIYTALTFFARRRSYVLGEQIFAELRENFISSVLNLPLIVVERAGTGDLLSRTTTDVESISRTVRFAVPEWLVALLQAVLTFGAMLLVSPLVAVAGLVSTPFLFFSTRWYLRYATPGYRRERMSYATLAGSMSETIEGARTMDALQLGQRQATRIDANVRESFFSEMYTLLMRMNWFPIVESAFSFAVACTLAWGGWLAIHHHVSIGAATTVTLYVVQLNDPLDRIIAWLDELQMGAAAFARLIGVSSVRDDRPTTSAEPRNEVITLRDVHYAYRAGHDVIVGVDLVVQPGERLAMVGPSGAGKSTLGRLIAGIDRPRTGSVSVGGVELADMPLDTLRQHVALVTQEHHIFIGSVRDNLALAKPGATDEEIRHALESVDAWEWTQSLPDGLATELGTTGHPLSPAQAQQLALARLVLIDPHTLVLDEATALLDPRAARHLERSMSAVLTGRTVIAIAHRLHTAHDADRVAVVDGGRVVELGTHDELLARDGQYASLWRSWRNEPSVES